MRTRFHAMTPRFAPSFVAFALTLTGSSSAYAEENLRTRTQPVLGGERSNRPEVLYVVTDGAPDGLEDHACSAFAVSPGLAMTARHCVSYFTEGTFACGIDGQIDPSVPRNPAGAGGLGLVFAPDRVHLYHGPVPDTDVALPTFSVHAIYAPETTDICRNDIAVLAIDLAADAPITTAAWAATDFPVLRLDRGLVHGEGVTVVGYGTNDFGTNEQTQLAGAEVLGIGLSDYYSVPGESIPRAFSVGHGPCHGDSGGPAFDTETGVALGLFSFLLGECQSDLVRNFYTQLAPYASFIRDAAEAEGETLRTEKDPSASTGGQAAQGGASSGGSGKTPSPEPATGCSWNTSAAGRAPASLLASALALALLWARRRSSGCACP